MTLTFLPILPLWAVALTGAVLVMLLAYGSALLRRKNIPGRWVAILGVLRLAAIVLFLLLLLRPVIHEIHRTVDRPNLIVMLDTSRGMGRDDAGNSDPRLHDALRTMEASGLRAKLEKSFDVSWFAFDEDARPVDADRVDKLHAEGPYTDLARSIETAWTYQHMQTPGHARLAGNNNRLLLMSDGNDQGGKDPVKVAQRLGLTVYTLAPRNVPARAVKPHILVADFHGPTAIVLGSEARFDAHLRIQGSPKPGPVRVVLQCDGQTVATRQLVLDGKQTQRHVAMYHQPQQAGRHEYQLQVRPAKDGPAFEAGPPQKLSIQVQVRRMQVLVLENSWRWSFHFLRRVLENDPRFAFTAFLSRRSGTYMQFAEPNAQPRLSGFPHSRNQLEGFDIIILGDVNPALWPPELAPAIHDLVVKQGKSLIVIAGPGLERLARTPVLRTLLPVEPGPNAGYVAGPIPIMPAPGALASSLFYTPQGDDFFQVFGGLPPMDQIYAPQRKRPGAGILLEARGSAQTPGHRIVMADQTIGRGRVLYIGTDTLWKWQTLASRDAQGRTPYQVFWHQALRAFTPRQADQAATGLVLQTDRSQYKVSQTVRFSVKLAGSKHAPPNAQMKLSIKLPDGHTVPLAVRPDSQNAGEYTARFMPPVPGDYTATVTAGEQAGDQTLVRSATRLYVAPRLSGPVPRRNNMAMLQRLASATGGTIVAPDNPQTWPHVETGKEHVVMVAQNFDLWRNASLLLVLIGVLSCDWLLRLLRGFV